MRFKGYGRAQWMVPCIVLLMILSNWIYNTYWNPHIDRCSKFGNITFQSDLTDVTDVEEGEITGVRLPFFYTGNTTAKVLEVKAEGDCGCTKLEISSHDLFPGDKHTLELTYDSRGQSEGMKEVKVFFEIINTTKF